MYRLCTAVVRNRRATFYYAVHFLTTLLLITYCIPTEANTTSTIDGNTTTGAVIPSSLSSENSTGISHTGPDTSELTTTTEVTSERNETIILLLGSNVTLTCPLVGPNEQLGFAWLFNGRILFLNEEQVLTTNASNVELLSSTTAGVSQIRINEIHQGNSGTYKCKEGDSVLKWFFVTVKMPIAEVYILCNMSSCGPRIPLGIYWINLQCYGDSDPTKPFIWTVANGTTPENMTHATTLMVPTGDNTIARNGSVLFLDVSNRTNPEAAKTVTCWHSDISKTISFEFDEKATYSSPEMMLVLVGVAGVMIFLIASVMYFLSTHFCWFNLNESASDHSSMYSMPSLTSEDRIDDETPRPVYRNDEGVDDVRTSSSTRKVKDSNQFEADMDMHGITLQSFRSRDTFNEFWDACLCGGDYTDPIVVRSLSGNATVDQLESFRLFQIGLKDLPPHPNVWNVLGFSNDRLPYRICYEFHSSTTVRQYLLSNFQEKDESNEQIRQAQTLTSLAADIANGMLFLKSYAFDHVALRTEKILISPTAGCKLYDFCLSSQSQMIAISALKNSELLAWLAPELVFLEEYNQCTDIWSYGVVLWEIWCGGRTPHCGKSRENLESDLRNQQYLVQPNNCPGAIYSLMLSCWKTSVSERRMFTDIHRELIRLKECDTINWYEDTEYASLPGSTFYNVLDNNYDKAS